MTEFCRLRVPALGIKEGHSVSSTPDDTRLEKRLRLKPITSRKWVSTFSRNVLETFVRRDTFLCMVDFVMFHINILSYREKLQMIYPRCNPS